MVLRKLNYLNYEIFLNLNLFFSKMLFKFSISLLACLFI